MPGAPRAPKALAKREVDRLIREAERHGNKRNLAILAPHLVRLRGRARPGAGRARQVGHQPVELG